MLEILKMSKFYFFLLFSILGIFAFFPFIYGDEEIAPKVDLSRESLCFLSKDTLFPISSSNFVQIKVIRRIRVIVTGYSSTPEETDDTPFLTAAGTLARDGIVANNLLPLHTKVRLPELFGDKIFTVEDRMNPKKGFYHIDVWFPTKEEALQFGSKLTYLEIIKIE